MGVIIALAVFALVSYGVTLTVVSSSRRPRSELRRSGYPEVRSGSSSRSK